MSIKINSMLDTTNNSWEVSLGGELDVSTADELKKELHKLVDEKNIDMRLNLENLDYIDSTGLGVIIGILKRLKIESKEVYIEKPKNNVRITTIGKKLFLNVVGNRKLLLGRSVCTFRLKLVRLVKQGNNNKTKRIVPTSIKEPNNPKSRIALASIKTRQKKALTVVILPINNGGTISFNALRLHGSCLR